MPRCIHCEAGVEIHDRCGKRIGGPCCSESDRPDYHCTCIVELALAGSHDTNGNVFGSHDTGAPAAERVIRQAVSDAIVRHQDGPGLGWGARKTRWILEHIGQPFARVGETVRGSYMSWDWTAMVDPEYLIDCLRRADDWSWKRYPGDPEESHLEAWILRGERPHDEDTRRLVAARGESFHCQGHSYQ
jgi:hypothetical protein